MLGKASLINIKIIANVVQAISDVRVFWGGRRGDDVKSVKQAR